MIIYEIKNKINGKLYIGQHSSNELGSYWGSGKLIKRAIEKYGIENFKRTILEKCSNKNELNEREKYWINEKDSINTGYNLTEGGTGGDNSIFINYSEEWKNDQSVRTKKYWDSLSDESRKERSDKVSGENNGMFGRDGYWKGKNIPKEVVQRGLESRRTYKGKENPNWKGGISKRQCKCGKDIAPINETCSYCRKRSGKNNPFYNKTHSDEVKEKLSKLRTGKKPTNTKYVEINGVVYYGLTEASIAIGIKRTTIWHRINSKSKKYKNYKYYEKLSAPLSN